jgi:hypothetical protein
MYQVYLKITFMKKIQHTFNNIAMQHFFLIYQIVNHDFKNILPK